MAIEGNYNSFRIINTAIEAGEKVLRKSDKCLNKEN